MKSRGKIIQATLVLFGTFGVIVPLAVLLLPATGSFPPAPPIIPDGGQVTVRPPKSQLSLNLRGINELSAQEELKLRPQQKKRLFAIVEPWLRRSAMSEPEASVLDKSLRAILTPAQRLWLQEWLNGYGSYAPSGFLNDKQALTLQEFRRTYNPFYAPSRHRLFSTLPEEMRQRYQQRYEDRLTFLRQWRDNSKE